MNGLYNFLLIVQVMCVVMLLFECAYIMFNWKTKLHGVLFFTCAASLVNSAGYYLEMIAGEEKVYLAALKMSYLGRIWVPFALFIFTMRLCGVKYKKRYMCVLAAFHLLVLVLVFTLENQNLYYTTKEFLYEGMFPHSVFGHGPIYVLYQYILLPGYVVGGITLLFINLFREKDKVVRMRLLTITSSILVESFFFVLGALGVGGTYDITMVGYALGALIMGMGLFSFDVMGTLEMAKDFCLEEIPEGVVVINSLGNLEYVNAKAKECFGIEMGHDIPDYLLKEKLEIMESKIVANEAMEVDGKSYSLEKKVLMHKGHDRGTVYVLKDNTEIFRYMEALKVQKELAEKAKEEAENASASKSAFISVVSHEIRTPMNAVVGMTDLLLRENDKLDDKQVKYLKNIKNSGSALVMIVNDILDQSKIEAGKMEIVEDNYELRPMVEDVKLIIETRIGTKPIVLHTDIADDVPDFLIGDSLRIRQILINLMNNAVKFTEEGYIRVVIELAESEADRIALKFTVKDSGQGIKPEDLGRLGEAFAQVDVKKNHSKEGTGLGLSISKNFVSLMGGRLEVDSVYGQGSSFFFTIWQGVAADSDLTKQAWKENEEFTCPNAKILIVDDTEINRLIAEEMLEPLGCAVDTADSGEKAIELIKKNTYHAVLMDYMMPYMDGVEATATIRGLGRADGEQGDRAEYYRSVPIITLTGDNSEGTREKFLKAGINDFMEKPISINETKKKLLKWLPQELIEK